MTIATTGTLGMNAKIQNLCTIFHGEALIQFYLLYNNVENTVTLNSDYYIKVSASYFYPVKCLSKQQSVMRLGMKKNAQPKSKTLCGALD